MFARSDLSIKPIAYDSEITKWDKLLTLPVGNKQYHDWLSSCLIAIWAFAAMTGLWKTLKERWPWQTHIQLLSFTVSSYSATYCGVTFEMAPYAQGYNLTYILRKNNIWKREVYWTYMVWHWWLCDSHASYLQSSSLAAFYFFNLILWSDHKSKSSSFPIILPRKKVVVKPYILII